MGINLRKKENVYAIISRAMFILPKSVDLVMDQTFAYQVKLSFLVRRAES